VGKVGRASWEPAGKHREILQGSGRTGAALRRTAEALPEVVTTHDPELRAVARHLLTRGSKRLRPALVFLSAEHGTFQEELLRPVAMALEVIHVASLYHDDVMDRAPLRRGGPSANSAWGNQAATIAGTYLLARANALLTAVGQEVVKVTAQAAVDICAGQLQEVEHAYDLELTQAEHLAIITRKTATLFELPCRLGALLSQAAPTHHHALASYGHHLGIAFQLADDALDLAGHPSQLGKTVASDLREGTYSLAVLEALAGPDGERLAGLLQRARLDPDSAGAAIGLVRASGAIEQALAAARDHAAQAQAVLGSLPHGPATTTLARLADYAVTREVPDAADLAAAFGPDD
jgi:heptaprenyl diphosphate synthase